MRVQVASFLSLPSSFTVFRKLLFDLESGSEASTSEDEQRASLGVVKAGDERCASLGVIENEASGDERWGSSLQVSS